MPWLVRDNDVLASLEVAEGFWPRAKGLLGRSEFDGALLLPGVRAVHTLGMRFPIDVAYCDDEVVVVRTVTMKPHRVDWPVRQARMVVEAEAGAFERWKLKVGDRLEVTG